MMKKYLVIGIWTEDQLLTLSDTFKINNPKDPDEICKLAASLDHNRTPDQALVVDVVDGEAKVIHDHSYSDEDDEDLFAEDE